MEVSKVVNWTLLLCGAIGLSFLLQRSSRRRRAKTLVTPEIPQDVLMEILVRLPAKSVIRLKGMSKSWSSLLSSRYFCNLFYMFPSRPQPSLVYMYISDIFDYSKSLLLSSSAAAPSSSSVVVVLDQDLTIPDMRFRYLCVLHGFICFTVCKRARIYNPATRQLVILPKVKSGILYLDVKYYIGHDPINDQYKILYTTVAVTYYIGHDPSQMHLVLDE